MNKGKITQIIIHTKENPKQKWIINCAYQYLDIQKLCTSAQHKQKLAISKISLNYYQHHYFQIKNQRHHSFIRSVTFNDQILDISNVSLFAEGQDFKAWQNYENHPVYLVRSVITVHFLILISLFYQKILQRKWIKSN